jgi:hypothetical protein
MADTGSGVSVNRLYGCERFILQSIQSGHVNVTFEREGHVDGFVSMVSTARQRATAD